jgi:hypothetical protein
MTLGTQGEGLGVVDEKANSVYSRQSRHSELSRWTAPSEKAKHRIATTYTPAHRRPTRHG